MGPWERKRHIVTYLVVRSCLTKKQEGVRAAKLKVNKKGQHSYTPRFQIDAGDVVIPVNAGFVTALVSAVEEAITVLQVEYDEDVNDDEIHLDVVVVAACDDGKYYQKIPKPKKEITDQQKQQKLVPQGY